MVYDDFQRIVDNIAERNREISSVPSPTTTTLPPCYDSDGGLKYDIMSGNVTGYYEYNRTLVLNGSEYCEDYKDLIEYYCESGILKSSVRECGGACLSGRCCVREGNLCGRDRDCCDGMCRAAGMQHYCVSS